jgi:replication factor A1
MTLAGKYAINPAALHNALIQAKDSKKAKCGPLSIQLREARNNTLCFMFSQNDRAVAQTTVSEYSLAKLRRIPPEIEEALKERNRRPTTTDRRDLERHIADLQVGLRHVNLKARVIDKSEVRAVQSRDGLPLAVCSATLSDGTGKIRLPLWNSQIDSIAKNDTVIIREATVRYFMGEMQLSIPRKTGSISIVH